MNVLKEGLLRVGRHISLWGHNCPHRLLDLFSHFCFNDGVDDCILGAVDFLGLVIGESALTLKHLAALFTGIGRHLFYTLYLDNP